MSTDRHGRDPGVADIIRYFDQPERSGWHLLTDKETQVLQEEIRKCAESFPYCARNYYWITTKDGSDTLLRFKETQEMVWETMRCLHLRKRGVRLLIIKARQLFISTFCEGYLAWATQFHPNSRGLLVSYDETHAAKLFSIVLHIYDQLPWWLRPMIGSREYKEGIHLINPDPDLRRINPGMNSRITVQGATQNVGVAEGETINVAHLSEFGSWLPEKARKVIMGDFRWALPDEPNTTAILETRVQRASPFVEKFWESMCELGDDADWFPLFIPIYFDRSHFTPPPRGWKPEAQELQVKERAAEEWCACSHCGQIRPSNFGGGQMSGTPCRDCKKGVYAPYRLQDGQMFWLQQRRMNAERMGEKALVEMQQSLATNPQEAFAHVTQTVFSKAALDWVASTARGDCLAKGYMSSDGVFHAPRRQHGQESAQCWAQGCRKDHSGESDRYLKIWQPPLKGAKYAMAVDVAAGYGGAHDYSVIIVNKLGNLPEPDIQVAQYRCNKISAWHLADVADSIGRWYNNALAIVDYTNYQTTGDRLLNYHAYPNIYRWVQSDAVRQQTNRWHWVWNSKNKESGWQILDGWLRDHSYVVKDPTLAKELRHFQRLPDGTLGAPDGKDESGLGESYEKIHDDTVTCAISLIVASHQRDPRRSTEFSTPQIEGVRAPGTWMGMCTKCEKRFESIAPCDRERCPFCGSIWLKWRMAEPERRPPLGFKFEDMGGLPVVHGSHGSSQDFSFGYGGANGQSY
jgi:hypothetical protein